VATQKKRNLVIVESPAKARTLAGFLGSGYDVRASIGHVRDLPRSRLGVDVEEGFVPRYVVPREKREVVRKLREAAQDADAVYLATDPDREGEAISWHLVEAAELGERPYHRVVFHEVTPNAVRQAFRHPRDIDMRLVDAQQARRVVDRLVGYKVSPLLWKKVRRGLSAGRVQSAAVRMVVDREREIEGFVPHEYWTIDARVSPAGSASPEEDSFTARLSSLAQTGTRRGASGGGRSKKLEVANAEESARLVALLEKAAYRVAEVKQRTQPRRPSPPFTTSTLQQEASRRFGFSAKRTMAVAQQLYEGLSLPAEAGPPSKRDAGRARSTGRRQVGLITYMRTDSTHVSEVARAEARAYIGERFGAEFLPSAPRVYRRKARGAQEAHEAIRPTSIRREPNALRRSLTPDQHRLYGLIWQRMLASQMADALYDNLIIDVEATPPSRQEIYLFRATENVLRFPGYRKLYQEPADNGSPEEMQRRLPALSAGQGLTLLALLPEQHFTEPPPRYTEATLVRALEENGIGRPSTYAPTLSTIQDRGYVIREARQLKPTDLGCVVNDLLVNFVPDVVDIRFTAAMEEELDEIARGQKNWQPVVERFYAPLVEALAQAAQAPRAEEPTDERCEVCGRPMVVRWGRFGRFLACSGFPECRSARPLPGEEEPQVTDEHCDLCGAPMVVRNGRYGRFLACSRYPECKGTRPLRTKVGVACPRCRGDLVARRTRRGRTFYGCANYPRCRFVTWSRPLAEPCPNCGDLLVAATRELARCLSCSWRGAPPLPVAAGVAAGGSEQAAGGPD
jgi:DNA topoisomerase-1